MNEMEVLFIGEGVFSFVTAAHEVEAGHPFNCRR